MGGEKQPGEQLGGEKKGHTHTHTYTHNHIDAHKGDGRLT